MKKLRLFLGIILLCLLSSLTANAEMILKYDGAYHKYSGSVFSLIVNNRQLNDLPMPPIIFNDRALVPIREIFEELGAAVNYYGTEQRVEVLYGNTYIRMYINDNAAYVNGKKTSIPDNVVPKLISIEDGETKTMVPVRFISETIGISVDFSSEHEAILVNSPGYSFDSPSAPEETPKPNVTNVSYSMKSSNTIEVLIEADTDIENYSVFTMSSPNRVVADITGFSLSGLADMKVNADGITAVRLGDNGERARVVIDVSGDIADYSAYKLSDTELAVKVAASPAAVQTPKPTTAPAATPKPTASPSVSASPTPTKRPAAPASSKLVVIDSGHGGKDSGAVGVLDGKTILEKDLTLQIAFKVKEILESKGCTVSMTRTTDTYLSLTEPPAQANEENAAVFVSIHINSAESVPEANGTEVYYSTLNNGTDYGTSSSVLAKNILSRMLYNMGSLNRGVKTADHAVTKRCNMPAVLVEVGFISNEDELRKMCSEDYQYKTAKGIAEGIIKTLEDIEIPEKKEDK